MAEAVGVEDEHVVEPAAADVVDELGRGGGDVGAQAAEPACGAVGGKAFGGKAGVAEQFEVDLQLLVEEGAAHGLVGFVAVAAYDAGVELGRYEGGDPADVEDEDVADGGAVAAGVVDVDAHGEVGAAVGGAQAFDREDYG